jgi:diguanylate cyclase (GGDEF)-like protein/PAS domain S-box-containing protein
LAAVYAILNVGNAYVINSQILFVMLNTRTASIPVENRIVFFVGCLGVVIGAIGISLSHDLAWIRFFDNLHWTAGTLAAAILAWLGYRQADSQTRPARFWFALGFGGYAIGQLIWDIQTWVEYSQFPSPSDCLYLWLGPGLVIGLIKEIRIHQNSAAHKIILLDTLSLSTAALTLVLVLYLPKRGDLDMLSLTVLIAYPVSLLMVSSTAMMMIPSLRLRLSPSLLVFIAMSLVTAWSWMRWNLMALSGTTIDGDLLNVSFSVAVLLAGFSLTFRRVEILRQPRWDQLCEDFLRFLPLVNVVLASMSVVAVTGKNTDLGLEQELTVFGALVVILLAMIRQAALLKDREHLLLTQSLLRTVLDTVPLRIFWKDRHCRYLGCNVMFARDAGETNPEKLIGKNDFQLSWREQAALYQADDYAVMNARQAKLNYEEPQTTPGGDIIYLRTSKVPLTDTSGEVFGILGIYDDITLLKEYEDRLKLTARIFENTQEGIMITDAERNLIDVNYAFTRVTGYTREEVLGKNPRILKSSYQSDDFYQAMWHSIDTTGHWSGEIWNRKKNGDEYPEWITISSISNEARNISHYVGICSDISLLKQHEKQLEHSAHYDALTGIPNRVLLADRMKQAIAQTHRQQKLLAVCYLDLDGFKPINDSYGHYIGDQVLIKIAERITSTMRETDTLARLGGDEFVLLLHGMDQNEECFRSLERLLASIAQPISINNSWLTVTASIGITIYPLDDHDPDTLLRHADQAMYQAKQSGKNKYYQYDTTADQHARSHQQFQDEIAQGLKNQQFELFYQPKVHMVNGEVAGVEALIRWRHPLKGLLPPARFLPVIENTELEVELGDWVIDRALAQSQQWLQQGHSIPISVNIAGQQLLKPNFVDKLIAAFAHYPAISHTLLELEILETAALEIDRSASVIQSVYSKLGVGFALDDFGTGYSTLTYLKQLPVSTLKIDQSFVRDMLEDSGDKAIVEGVIALAKVFGRTTVAEGVETDQHFQTLKAMGCQIAQGYGIAKPMPENEFMQWYLSHCKKECLTAEK